MKPTNKEKEVNIMSGYTAGVAKGMSEDSQLGKLFVIDEVSIKHEKETATKKELFDALYDEGYELDDDELNGLYDDECSYDDTGNRLDFDGDTVTIYQDMMSWIDDNSQGGLYYILDSDKNLVGARLGVCGEHVGSVSVWLDTFHQVVEQDGKTYPITNDDCDEINDQLNEYMDY